MLEEKFALNAMHKPKQPRFLPRPMLAAGLASWLILTVVVFSVLATGGGYPIHVLAFGLALTALAMSFVASWATLLVALLLNWVAKSRRTHLKHELVKWTVVFGAVSTLAIWSIVFLDS